MIPINKSELIQKHNFKAGFLLLNNNFYNEILNISALQCHENALCYILC